VNKRSIQDDLTGKIDVPMSALESGGGAEVASGRVTHDEDDVGVAAKRTRMLFGPDHALHATE
jgi:hypothetical protein